MIRQQSMSMKRLWHNIYFYFLQFALELFLKHYPMGNNATRLLQIKSIRSQTAFSETDTVRPFKSRVFHRGNSVYVYIWTVAANLIFCLVFDRCLCTFRTQQHIVGVR